MEFGNKCGRFILLVLQEMLHQARRALSNFIKKWSLGSKMVVTLSLVLCYGHLLATSWEWSGDQVEIGCLHVLIFLPTLRFLSEMYIQQCLIFFLRLLSAYGWMRILTYTMFLFTFSYGFVAIFLDNSALMFIDKATKLFLDRFENNFLQVDEHRPYLNASKIHPLSGGSNSPDSIHHLIRYPMEDVQMKCSTVIRGFPGGEPFANQVEWRRNGVPLTITDRHSVISEFQELAKDDPLVDKKTKAWGLSSYKLASTLSIYLLDTADFGSYTCHIRGDVSISVKEWMSKTGQKPPPEFTQSQDDQSSTKKKSPKTAGRQCTCHPERIYFFQDVHTQIEEYRLIRMEERHDQIEASITSVLFFSTAYVHLSSDSDVLLDYTVNDVSFRDLCNDNTMFAVHGCSSLQQLLAYFTLGKHRIWWFPDFHPSFFSSNFRVSEYHKVTGHCLCENSFGRHTVKYLRTYYNRTSKQNELIEIAHPHTLLVRPPKQHAPLSFAGIWHYGSIHLLPLAEYLPEHAYDLTILKDLAIASGIILTTTDAFFIGVGLGFLCVFCQFCLYLFKFVGQASKKCLLEGSMGFLFTAKLTSVAVLREERNRTVAAEREKYDLFLSFSDSQTDQHVGINNLLPLLEGQLDLKVCVRERDLPPHKPELLGLSQAIDDSKRFIILLSEAFLQDACRQLEVNMVIESLWERGSQPHVLVIKMDDSEVPAHWTDFTLHDWASGNLGMADHHLRLVKWLTPHRQLGREYWSMLDISLLLLPFVFLIPVQFAK